MLKDNQTECLGQATSWAFDVVGSGYEVIKIMFALHGARSGQSREWTGFLNNESVERTLQAMRHCGWTGETFGDLTGMGTAVVSLILETRKDGEKTYEQVRFVNRAPSLRLKNPMGADAVARFSERMARLTADSKRNYGSPAAARAAQAQPAAAAADAYDNDDDVPF